MQGKKGKRKGGGQATHPRKCSYYVPQVNMGEREGGGSGGGGGGASGSASGSASASAGRNEKGRNY